MDLELTPEQEALVDVFGSLAERACPVPRVRDHEALGFAPGLWEQLRTAGAPGMGVPETRGGGGATVLDLALVAEALGRRLAPAPFVEHTVAARLLGRVDALTDAITDGTEIATLALRPAAGGRARLVPAGAVATVVVALDGDELVCAHDEPPGVAVPNLASAPLADRALAPPGTKRRVLAAGAEARALLAGALDEWRVLTAALLAGVGAGALDVARAYVCEREQFGVPIGSFQAVQHSLADLAVALDGARLLFSKAAWATDEQRDDAPWLAGAAFLFCTEQARRASERGLHFHGGYGFMEEYDIQLFYRRAKGWALVLDEPRREHLRLADVRYGAVGASGAA